MNRCSPGVQSATLVVGCHAATAVVVGSTRRLQHVSALESCGVSAACQITVTGSRFEFLLYKLQWDPKVARATRRKIVLKSCDVDVWCGCEL